MKLLRKIIVFIIIGLFIGVVVVPSLSGNQTICVNKEDELNQQQIGSVCYKETSSKQEIHEMIIIEDSSSDINFQQSLNPIILLLNRPPNTPSEPSGPSSCEVGKKYRFCTSATDPDGDPVRYYWTTGGSDYWTDYYPPGSTRCVSIYFSSCGTYYIKVLAQDIHGLTSDFSPSKKVVVTPPNNAPLEPDRPEGFTSGYVGVSYTFSTVSSDLNGDNIQYGWDWTGDFTVDFWSEFKSSGSTESRSHIWYNAGSYNVQVKAVDIYDASSSWSSPLEVTIKPSQPDLESEYTLCWSTVKPGTTVNGSFNIKNVGTPGSMLDWAIESYPNWGEWTFNPPNGDNLKTEDVPVTVKVSVIVPNEEESDFSGEVKVVNTENSEDYELIPVTLTTSKNKSINTSFIQFLKNRPYVFPSLRNILCL